MSILFDFYESPPQEGDGDKKRYHARPMFSGTVSTEMLAAIIHDRSSLSVGDILSTITNLGLVLSEQLQDGRRVCIDGIGYFHVSLSCPEIRTKKDMRADKVHVKSVVFRAHKHLKSDMMKVKAERSDYRRHSARLSNEEIDIKLTEYFKENQVLTRRDFQSLCQMTQETALRHIRRLLTEGKLKNIGISRQPIYVPQVQEEE